MDQQGQNKISHHQKVFKCADLVKLPDSYADRYLYCNEGNYNDRLTCIYALGGQNKKNGRDEQRVLENIDILEEICKTTKDDVILKFAKQSLRELKNNSHES
jgi:hypothetical protein